MTQLTPRLKIAILKSKLPDKAILSALAAAEKAAVVPPAPAPVTGPLTTERRDMVAADTKPATVEAGKRNYGRRDAKAKP